MSSDVAVAVDVGGTTIKGALVDPAGEVRLTRRYPTGRERGPDAVVTTILDAAADLAAAARAEQLEPVAAGIVVPAVVDEVTGVAEWSANLGLRGVPLKMLAEKRLGLPAALGHDVRAGALAEARLGAGREVRRLLFVAIGTGIAGGFAVDGRVDPGAHGAAGEIGHIAVRPGPRCGCGGLGCLEAVASAAAIARTYGVTEAAEVASRAAAGEARAAQVWQEAVDALADGLLTAIAFHDPELIALGGGLAQAGDTLFAPLTAALHARKTFHRLPRLVPAQLGESAGYLGAALLALSGRS